MWVALALAVAVIAGALVSRYLIGGWFAEDIRGIVAHQLEASLGRPVSLGGMSGDVIHGVVLHNLRIAERGGFDRGVAFSAAEVRLTFNWARLLAPHPDVVGGIARAELDEPHLVLSRDAVGRWSIADLISPTGASGPVRFRGLIVIRRGGLVFRDAWDLPGAPFAATFTRLEGQADFRRGDPVPLALTGWSSEGEGLSLAGRYHPGGTAAFDITATNASAAHWGAYLVRIRQLAWEGGRFGGRVHLSLTPSATGIQLDYAANLQMHDTAVQYRPSRLEFQHISGPLVVDGLHVETPGLVLVAGTSPMVVDGAMVYAGGPWLQLGIKTPALDLATVQALFFPNAPLTLSGKAGGEIRVTGPVSALDLDGEIAGAQGRINGQPFDGLHARLQYGAGILSLTGLRTDAAGGRLAGDLVLDAGPGTASYLFNGTTSDVDVRALASAGLSGLTAVTGRVSGRVVGVGTGTHVQVMGDVRMGSGSLRGLGFDGLHAIFWHDADGSVNVDALTGRIDGATVYSSGRIGADGVLDLDVLAQHLSLADIAQRTGLRAVPLDGYADLQGHATGTTAAPVFTGTVTATDGRLGPVAFAHAVGDVAVSPQGISSRRLDVQDGSALYTMSGGITFRPLAAADLRLEATGVEAQWLTNALAFAPDVTGALSADVTVNGPLVRPSVSGEVTLDRGRIGRQRIDHAEVHLAPDGGRLRIAAALAQVNGSHLAASGTIDPAGPLDLRIRVDGLNLADIDAALGLALPVGGVLSLDGTLGGTLSDPRVSGTVIAPDLIVGGEAFAATGGLEYGGGTLRLNSLQLAQGAARYQLSGVLRVGEHPSAGLVLAVDHGQVATVLAASGITLPAPLAGIIDGRIEFSGPLDDPSAHLSLALQDATFGPYTIGSGVADLTMTHQTIDIDRFEIHPAQGQVAAKGRVDLRGSSQVEVSAQDLNPDFLRPFFQIDRPFQGKLNFTVQLSGETRNPTAGLSMEATDAGIAGALADRIAGLAYYQAGTLHIEQAVISKGPHKVVAVGTLPVDQKTFAFDPNAPMQLQLRLQDADLSFLTLLTPQVTDAAGTVAGEVDVAGTVGKPQMSGFLHSTGGRLTYAGLRKPFDKLNVDLVFSQNEIHVRDLSAALGQGQVALGGIVGVTNFRLGDIGLALKAIHADIDAPGLYTGLLDADLRLSGPALEPVLSGSATLSNGVLSPAGTGGGAGGGGGPRLGLDVTLAVGRNVVFSLGPVRAEVAGSVHAAGTLAHPLLSGRVTSPQGEVAFLGSTFRLTGGEAVFSEALGVEPQISARAQQVYGDTIVFLDVRGLASHPDLTVTSDPPLTQADILNLVARNAGIFGDPGSILGQGLGRYLLGSLREALDLSEFTLTYNRESPVTLRIGKFLLQNIYVTVSEVFAGPQVATIPFPGTFTRPVPPDVSYTVAGLEYFLSPNVLATFNVDTLGGMGVFLLTRFPF